MKTFVILCLVGASLLPAVSAFHPYQPDYPDVCVEENETSPAPGSWSDGSYACDGAVYLDCLAGTGNCRVCESYTYDHGHYPMRAWHQHVNCVVLV